MISKRRTLAFATLLLALPAFAAQPPAPPAPPVSPPPVPPPPPPLAVVLDAPNAVAWLNAAGIPAHGTDEAGLPAVLAYAALAVVPVQDVRLPATVDALKAFTARGGKVLAAYWGPVGLPNPVAAGMGPLLGVNVGGWSGRGNAMIIATPAGRGLFNGTGRLRLNRGYAVVATPLAPPASVTTLTAKPNTSASLPPTPQPLSPIPFAAGRWVREDGKAARTAPNDAAAVQTPSSLWVGEDIFAPANDTPEVRRFVASAAVSLVPAFRLIAKQAVLAAAQRRVEAVRAMAASAPARGFAPLPDAAARLAAAQKAVTDSANVSDFSTVLANVENADDALTDAQAAATPSRPAEVRAAWVSQASLTRSPADLLRLVNRLADARFNVLLPETVYRGRTAYPGTVYPQDTRFGGFDPLRLLIDAAHRRGMEVHPWVHTLCVGENGDQGPLLRSHPEWSVQNRAGRTMGDPSRRYWLSLSVPAARTAVRNVVREIAAKYDVDGIALDDLRYDGPAFDYSDAARAAYTSAAGADPATLAFPTPAYARWHAWREEQASSLVRDIRDDLRPARPALKLGAAVDRTPDDARRDHLQDWAFWLRNRWLDWAAPIGAATDAGGLDRGLATDVSAAIGVSMVVPGFAMGTAPDAPSLPAQIVAARAQGAQGVSVVDAAGLTEDALRSLRLGAFRDDALVPWKDPLRAARLLNGAASALLRSAGAPDPATADAARAAASALDTLPITTRNAPAISTAFDASAKLLAAPALADARYDEAHSLVADARQIIAATVPSPAGSAQPTPPPIAVVTNPLPLPSVRIPRVAAGLTLDGKLDEPAWANAALLELAHTNTSDRAPIPTTVRVMRDEANLYFGLTCTEPSMPTLKAAHADHDGRVYEDDSVEIFLSPDASGMPYYHFIAGAGGGMGEDRSGDAGWNARWSAAVARDVTSWSVEIAIPFNSIGGAPTEGGTWRANVARSRMAQGAEYLVWSVPYGSYHTPDRFGEFRF